MMKTIWKFPFEVKDEVEIEMSWGAEVLCVDVQRGQPCLWAMVDSSWDKEGRTFYILGTGHPAERVQGKRYIGTFQMHAGNLIFHVFE